MRQALGKGLAQLIGEQAEASQQEIEISRIRPNARQPRTEFKQEALEDLAASIKAVGILQPLVVRPVAEGQYELIAGERRYRACQIAGLKTVPVVVRAASSQVSLELALIENLQREDISPLECALAYKRLAEEFDLNQEAIATKVGKNRATISNTLRLLKLPESVLDGLRSGTITEGHARAILMAETPAQQVALYRKIEAESLNVRQAEKLARKEPTVPSVAKKSKPLDPDWKELERAIADRLGANVSLVRERKGGKISIEFYSDDDLQRILDLLGISL